MRRLFSLGTVLDAHPTRWRIVTATSIAITQNNASAWSGRASIRENSTMVSAPSMSPAGMWIAVRTPGAGADSALLGDRRQQRPRHRVQVERRQQHRTGRPHPGVTVGGGDPEGDRRVADGVTHQIEVAAEVAVTAEVSRQRPVDPVEHTADEPHGERPPSPPDRGQHPGDDRRRCQSAGSDQIGKSAGHGFDGAVLGRPEPMVDHRVTTVVGGR